MHTIFPSAESFPESNWSTPDFDCRSCPDYDCRFQADNGFFRLDITLKGPASNPPYLARLYCRKNRIGRFLVHLGKISEQDQVKLHGTVPVRCGDILEWKHNNIRKVGLINERGVILALNMFYSCHDFQKALKRYLQTKRMQHIEPFVGNPFLVKGIFQKNSLG